MSIHALGSQMRVCKSGHLDDNASLVHTESKIVATRPNSIPTIAFVVSTYDQSVGVNHSTPFTCSPAISLMSVTPTLKIIEAYSPRIVCQNCI